MFLAAVFSIAACRGPEKPRPPSERDIVARSHAFLEAVDHDDIATVTSQLGAHYVHFEGTYRDAADDLASLDTHRANLDPSNVVARTSR